MTKIEREGMIAELLFDDVRIIKDDLIGNDDPNYLMFLLEERKPYSKWSDSEIEEAWHELALRATKPV